MASKGQNRATAAPLLIILATTALLYGIIALNGWGFEPKLGLDLQGGTSVILTPKTVNGGQVSKASVQKAVDIIRQRVNGSGVSEAEVTREGNNILVSIPGADKKQLEQVDKTAQLRFRMVLNQTAGSSTPQPSASPTDSASPTGSASPSASVTGSASASPSSTAGSSSTPSTSGTPSPTASASGNGRALTGGLVRQASGSVSPATSAPQSTSPPAASASPSATADASPTASAEPSASTDPNATDPSLPTGPGADEALATFAALDCFSDEPAAVALRERAAESDADETKTIATCSEDGSQKLMLGPAVMTGRDVRSATATIPANEWIVTLQLNGDGKKKFSKLTAANVGKEFAIVLDGRVVSHPTINEAIPGDATISGSFTKKTATDLANVLKYGALPLSFERSQTDQISPTLGKKSLHAGLVAGFLGLGIVVLYVLAYYRGLGLVTVFGLLLFAALNYALVVILGNTMGFTLTMAGIAGLIVSVGITADSYVVFYERLKDEVREGRSLRGSVDKGFARAWRTIISADTVSFMAAAILYWLSIGAVRGFAFTLGLSTLLDVAIAWMFTRPVVTMLSRTRLFSEGRFVGIKSAVTVTAPVRATRTPKEA